MMYPEAVAQLQSDLTAIQAFNAGKLTQDFCRTKALANDGKQTSV
jgi:hypothetical protein